MQNAMRVLHVPAQHAGISAERALTTPRPIEASDKGWEPSSPRWLWWTGHR